MKKIKLIVHDLVEKNKFGKVRRRVNFLSVLPKNGVISEIGVKTGGHANEILNICNPKKMYLIDSWDENDEYFNEENSKKSEWHNHYTNTINLFKGYDFVHVIKKKSHDALFDFEDNYFDAIYIDASHRYHNVLSDLNKWYPKVKNKGVLCGHDFTIKTTIKSFKHKMVSGELGEFVECGVPEAVINFCEQVHEKNSLTKPIELNLYLEEIKPNIEHYEWLIIKNEKD